MLSEVAPLVPTEVAQIRYVRHLTIGSKMRVLPLKLEEVFCRQVEDLTPSLRTVIPQAKRRVALPHILPHTFLDRLGKVFFYSLDKLFISCAAKHNNLLIADSASDILLVTDGDMGGHNRNK